MRIDGTFSTSTFAPASARRRSDRGEGFALESRQPTASRVLPHEAMALCGIETMLALQGLDAFDSLEEGMQRGTRTLDLLDELKVALLEGGDDAARLDRLAALVAGSPEPTGQAGLDEVLAAIDLRAKVELAKRGR